MADKKSKRLSPVSADGPKDVLQAIEDTLRSGSIPKGPVIPADDEARKKLDEILAGIVDTQQFALAMAEGDLSRDLNVKGHMAGSLKALQSSLRHLTWQAGQIAGGDLSQRVNFMGEFSDSFNVMVEHLSEDKIHRDQREEELRSVNSALAREVAERRGLEGTLRLQNQIFETIAEGIYLIRTEDGVIVETNSKFDRMFGYEKGELIGRHVSLVNAPQETKSPMDTAGEIMSVLNDQGKWRGELKTIKKDGTTFWCLAVVSTFNHPEFGNVWIAAHTDITARKLAEEALKESEQKFREIFNDINDGIELHEVREDGLPGKYLEVNEVTCRMLGYTREELLQHSPLDFTTEYHNRPLEEIGREILTKGHSRFETGHRNRAGGVVPVEINAHVLRHDNKILSVVRDITGRKKAEEEERLTRERFETLVKVSEMRDASETELSEYVLEAACRMTESTLAFIGTMTPDESAMDLISWSKSTMPDCRVAGSPIHFPVQRAGIWADAVRTRKPEIVNEYLAPHPGKKGLPEGHVRITRFLSLPILDNGKVVMVAAVANKPDEYDDADVTRLALLMQGVWGNLQKRRSEEALRMSEQKFRDIFNNTSDAILLHEIRDNGPPGTFIDVNAVACRMLGYTREEIIAKTPLEITTDYHNPSVEKILEDQRTTGRAGFETEYRAKDGTIIPVEINTHVVTLQGKRLMLGAVRDITARRKAEDDLRQSEERFRIMFDESPISFWEEDFSDVKHWIDTRKEEGVRDFRSYFETHPEDILSCIRREKVTRINHAGMALFGAHSQQEFSGGLSSFFTADSPDTFREELIALSTGKTSFECEVPFRTVSGERKIVLLKMIVVPGFEPTLGKMILSFLDITERKKMEDALRQANRKITMLSSITRHDIRNQVMVLRSYLALSRIKARDPELLDFMTKEDRAAEAISNQIEFTKYYEDIGINAPEWQDIPELIQTARSQLPVPGTLDITVDLPPMKVFADGLIGKVFYNLLENTLRHGGPVTRIRISFYETDTGAEIVYEDNGVGIPPEDKPHLFQKGFGKNTGLGLFLSQEILAITGLTIRESGEPGKGARFAITLPKGAYRTGNTP